MKSQLVVSTIAVIALGLTGCSTNTEPSSEASSTSANAMGSAAYPQEYSSCGTMVTVDKQPEKIVAAGREGVANLVSAGAVDKMIARYGEHGAQQSPEVEAAVKNVKQLESSSGTDHQELSFESVLALEPDMLYGEGLGFGDYEVPNLEKHGIKGIIPPSACLYITSVDEVNRADLKEITQTIRNLGKVVGTSDAANENANKLDKEIQKAKEAGADLSEMSVAGLYYWDATDDLFAYGANSTLQGIFDLAKIKNAVDPSYDAMLNGAIQPEAIIAANPQVIVITTGEGGITLEDSLRRLKKIPGMAEVDAIENNRIIELPSGAAYPIADAINAAKTVVDQRSKY